MCHIQKTIDESQLQKDSENGIDYHLNIKEVKSLKY